MKFVKQVKVPSQTDPKKSYTVSFDAKGNASCSCKRWVSTSPRVDCKHIKSVQSGKKLQSKEKVMAAAKKARKNRKSIVEAPTTRGTLIRLLMKQKNKLVAMKAIYAEVKKVKGWDDDKRVQSKVKAVISSVKAWAGQHDFKLVTSSNGLKLQSE